MSGVRVRWPARLIEGSLLRRYHRFLCDVQLPSGEVVVAHCVNTGCMEGLVRPGARAWLCPAASEARRLRFTWVMTEDLRGERVGTDTSLPNRAAAELLAARALPGLRGHRGVRAEAPFGEGSRVDFVLTTPRGPHWLEVKNCHLVYPDGVAYFPDSVSERAARHMRELAALARAGERASVLFVAQRSDAERVRPSDAHDPVFADAAREAARAGVRFRAVRMRPSLRGMLFDREIPVDLAPYDLDLPRRWRDEGRAFSGWERPRRGK